MTVKRKKRGHWVVTPPRGESRRFETTKAMVAYIRKHRASLISWVEPQ
jgi:hypothetical protein